MLSFCPNPPPGSSKMTPLLPTLLSSVFIYFYDVNLWYLDSEQIFIQTEAKTPSVRFQGKPVMHSLSGHIQRM